MAPYHHLVPVLQRLWALKVCNQVSLPHGLDWQIDEFQDTSNSGPWYSSGQIAMITRFVLRQKPLDIPSWSLRFSKLATPVHNHHTSSSRKLHWHWQDDLAQDNLLAMLALPLFLGDPSIETQHPFGCNTMGEAVRHTCCRTSPAEDCTSSVHRCFAEGGEVETQPLHQWALLCESWQRMEVCGSEAGKFFWYEHESEKAFQRKLCWRTWCWEAEWWSKLLCTFTQSIPSVGSLNRADVSAQDLWIMTDEPYTGVCLNNLSSFSSSN